MAKTDKIVPIQQKNIVMEKLCTIKTAMGRRCHARNTLLRQFLGEVLGTAILLTFGDGSVAQSVLSRAVGGEILSINLGWGLGVTMGVAIAAQSSGAHLNPAITLMQFILGNIKLIPTLVYMLGQYIGAFLGAAVVYITYAQAFNAFDGGVRIADPAHPNFTAAIFSTYPKPYLDWGGGLIDQIVGTALLALCVMAVTDARNLAVPLHLIPPYVGGIVTVIGLTFCWNCGYAINPARDLGPRIFMLIAGWGVEVFSYRNYNWFWVPVIGPYVGATLGAMIWKLFVGLHWPKEEDHRKEEADETLMLENKD